MTSTEKIKDSFPHPTIDPIIGQPGYDSIKPMHQKLNANAASIISHLGNGRLGLLFLTVAPAVFNTLSATAFVPPVNPGPLPHYPPRCNAIPDPGHQCYTRNKHPAIQAVRRHRPCTETATLRMRRRHVRQCTI